MTRPTPKDNEVLIKVHASTVTVGDWRIQTLTMPKGFKTLGRLMFGWSTPRDLVLGTELVGEIVEVGANVKKFAVGDRVLALLGMKMGGYTQLKCLSQDAALVKIPAHISYLDIVSVPFGAMTAYDFLFKKAKLASEEKILIYGASGAVGSAAVQIAKHKTSKITAVCSSKNHPWVKDLGASDVIDYNTVDFTKMTTKYDVVMDCVGTLNFSKCRDVLNPNGRLLLVAAGLPDMLSSLVTNSSQSKKVCSGPVTEKAEDLQKIVDMVAVGVLKPLVDKVYAASSIGEAFAYVGQRHKRGNVVLDLTSL